MPRRIAFLPVILIAIGVPPALAQQPPEPPASGAVTAPVDPQKAQHEAALAAEDLTITRLLADLQLTEAQMRRLLPTLEAAQAKLDGQEDEARRALAALQPKLEEARRALLAGKDGSTRAEGQAAEQAQRSAGERRQLRADWVRAIRRALTGMLSAHQQSLLGNVAQAIEQRERTARSYASATSGRGGGGPIGWLGRALDRLRRASEAEAAEQRFRIAMRLSELSELDDQRRDRGEEGFSSEDPDVQRRLALFYSLLDRVRQMPDAQYRQSRDELALQLWSARAGSERGFGGSATARDAAIDRMVDRYFLSPRMVVVMRARTAASKLQAPSSRLQVSDTWSVERGAWSEDLTILRAVAPLRLTTAQLGPLVQRLQAGAERLQAAEKADAGSWVAATQLLRRAIAQAAARAEGRPIDPSSKAEAEYARVQLLARGKRNAALEQTRMEVRELLDRSLNPMQKAALVSAGRAEVARERVARLESDEIDRLERTARELDRLREASAAEWPARRRRFALEMANVPGGRDAARAVRSATARRGGEATVRQRDGLEREERRLRREEARLETRAALDNPARQAQVREFQMLADQVRAMPPPTFAQRRMALALQLYRAQSRVRGQTASAEEAMAAFIERYLLSPRAPVVLAERLRAMGV